ncbi:MAG TPA: 2'-5' RNA ligase family protein, partial [Acidimicrobiales bacterium]|nr:2'-5' RNA ligase family protein [Acidimicrobiales bacterium]
MRLFVAVWPPEEVVGAVASAVAALSAAHPEQARALRWTGPEQWHVTLRFLGDAGLDEAARAFRAVAAPARPGPATAVLGPATGRFGRRVLHLPVAGLDDLAAAVVAATAGVGEPPEDRPFAGHLTLA